MMSNISVEVIQLKPTDTSCKECCFATYEGKTQTRCSLNKLELFRKAKIDILEAYDNDKEFYVLCDKKCIWWRNYQWATKRSNPNKDVLEESLLKVCYVIYCDIHTCANDLNNTLSCIKNDDLQPLRILIINNGAQIKPSEVKRLCNIDHNLKNKWSLEIIIHPDLDLEKSLSVSANKLVGQYTAVFFAGKLIPNGFISVLDKIINTYMEPVLFQKVEEHFSYTLFQNFLFKICGHRLSNCQKMVAELSAQENK